MQVKEGLFPAVARDDLRSGKAVVLKLISISPFCLFPYILPICYTV